MVTLDKKLYDYEQMTRETVALTIVKCLTKNAQHNKSSQNTIIPIIEELGGTLANGTPIPPSLFTVNYDRGFPIASEYGAFVVVMPQDFASALIALDIVIEFKGQQGIPYAVKPEPYVIKEQLRAKAIDTIKWLWIDVPKGYTPTDAALEAKITNELAKRAKLQLTKFYRPKLKGTAIQRHRQKRTITTQHQTTTITILGSTSAQEHNLSLDP